MKKRLIFISIILSLSAFSCSKKAENADNFLHPTISFESYSSGKITILNENSLKINDICKIEVIPNQSYYLSDLFLSTNEKISFVDENIYSFKVVEGENKINATFKKANYNISIGLKVISNNHGNINFISSIFKENVPIKFIVLPEDDYEIDNLTINNEVFKLNDDNIYTFTPKRNLNFIEISFKECDINSNYRVVDEMIVEKTVVDTTISSSDPYLNVTHDEFYANYSCANSYEEAYFRTKNYLLSGDITLQSHISSENYAVNKPKSGSSYLMSAYMRYEVDKDMNYVSYTVNSLNNKPYKIYYNAAYQSLNDVSAYLFAFLETPVNWYFEKNISKEELKKWDTFARVNVSTFSGDTEKYPYEPLLTGIDTKYNYYECDFGTKGDYYVNNRYEDIYNNGEKITRGAARLVFNYSYKNSKDTLSPNERHVFYTYNHYNDFEEYLNYEGGFTSRFGNESVGNSADEVNKSNPPSNPKKILKALI